MVFFVVSPGSGRVHPRQSSVYEHRLFTTQELTDQQGIQAAFKSSEKDPTYDNRIVKTSKKVKAAHLTR